MKVAIVHYWLVNMRGGEKVVQALCDMFPQADIFTHVYDPDAIGDAFEGHTIKTSFIQRLPGSKKFYQNYLPLMPLALEQLDLREYDLVISSESGPAKGVITSPETLHVCYCHTPMRYVWDMYHDYMENTSVLKRMLMPPLIHYLRQWDLASASRVDHFIANSQFVSKRISKFYHRQATVIHPPVNTEAFTLLNEQEDFYLLVGQLNPYKRADLAVKAFNESGRKLVVIGDGEQIGHLRQIARKNVTILGRQPSDVIRDYYQRCRALIFPGVEDFGMVPVEAMASGRPVIAFGRGGALETVKENVTGLFFNEQSVESLNAVVESFEMSFNCNSLIIKKHASQFGQSIFKESFMNLVDTLQSQQEMSFAEE